jgi:SAM-dependent methyltransferase
MQSIQRSANRVLDLSELERPDFRQILASMDELLHKEDISYLHPSKRWEYPWALNQADLVPDSRVLDAGCGASIFPIYLANEGYRVSAVDLAPPVGLERLHDVDVDSIRGELTALPFADNSFDVAFCISVIEHLGRNGMSVALNELRRVIRYAGRLLLTTDYYEDASAELWYEGEDRRFRVDWSFVDAQQLEDVILEAPGFRVDGEVDLSADWDTVRTQMRRFHGYPYTSVGIALVKV